MKLVTSLFGLAPQGCTPGKKCTSCRGKDVLGVHDGLLPVAQLPVTVGDQKLNLSIYKDQTPAEAAAKFVQQVCNIPTQ